MIEDADLRKLEKQANPAPGIRPQENSKPGSFTLTKKQGEAVFGEVYNEIGGGDIYELEGANEFQRTRCLFLQALKKDAPLTLEHAKIVQLEADTFFDKVDNGFLDDETPARRQAEIGMWKRILDSANTALSASEPPQRNPARAPAPQATPRHQCDDNCRSYGCKQASARSGKVLDECTCDCDDCDTDGCEACSTCSACTCCCCLCAIPTGEVAAEGESEENEESEEETCDCECDDCDEDGCGDCAVCELCTCCCCDCEPEENPMTAEELKRGARTAMTRSKPSLPMRELEEQGLLQGRMLDYGAGKGFDADRLGMEKYDPTFWPEAPEGSFDTITCNYVLNVVPPESEDEILGHIEELLAPGGTAYIAVRRDVKRDGLTGSGTYQRRVELDLPVLVEKKGAFAIYVLEG
jgi:hypothetical protein